MPEIYSPSCHNFCNLEQAAKRPWGIQPRMTDRYCQQQQHGREAIDAQKNNNNTAARASP